MYLYTTVSSLRSCICLLRFKWSVMWPITWTAVYKYMTDHLNRSVQMFVSLEHVVTIKNVSLGRCGNYKDCFYRITGPRFKWAVMYLHTTVQVSSHAFFNYGSSERSCICILWFKWAVVYLHNTDQVSVMYLHSTVQVSVMYLHSTAQVSCHVFTYYDSSERSCICILRFKWAVMYP
jgi:hypothetical protein